VAGPYTSNCNAIAALRGVERRLAPGRAKFRICSGCRTGFMTTGKTHCPDCLKEGKRHG
jgi:predicted amidophosphoribosyltransferase